MAKNLELQKDQNLPVLDAGAILATVNFNELSNEQLTETLNTIVSVIYATDNVSAPVLPEGLKTFNPLDCTDEQMADYASYLNTVKIFKADKTANIARSNAIKELFSGILANEGLTDVSTFLLAWVKNHVPTKVTVNKVNRIRKQNTEGEEGEGRIIFADVCRKHFYAGSTYDATFTDLQTTFNTKPDSSIKADLSWHKNKEGYMLTEESTWVSK